MLCISESGNFRIKIRLERTHFNPKTGDPMSTDKRLFAQFTMGGGIPDYARDAALERLEFKALPLDVNPLERLGWWDSEMYAEEADLSEADKRFVEEYMRAHDGEGYIIAERPKVEAPWPTYLEMRRLKGRRDVEFIVEEIAQTARTIGVTPAEIVAFEEQEKLTHWEQVVARMHGLAAEAGEESAEAVVAA